MATQLLTTEQCEEIATEMSSNDYDWYVYVQKNKVKLSHRIGLSNILECHHKPSDYDITHFYNCGVNDINLAYGMLRADGESNCPVPEEEDDRYYCPQPMSTEQCVEVAKLLCEDDYDWYAYIQDGKIKVSHRTALSSVLQAGYEPISFGITSRLYQCGFENINEAYKYLIENGEVNCPQPVEKDYSEEEEDEDEINEEESE